MIAVSPESEITSSEWFMLNHFIHGIKKIKTTCVSVYYPFGKGNEVISLLRGTKRNQSLEKIESEIEKQIAHLSKNPSSVGKFPKTLCIFGCIENGKVKLKEIGTSKKLPYIYMVSKKPFLKPFKDILKTQHNVLLVILDQKFARFQKFNGSNIVEVLFKI